MKITNKEKFQEILKLQKRLSDMMSNAVQSYYIWKTLALSLSIPVVGKEEAEKNAYIMNKYKNFFVQTEENHLHSFIIGLSKFFDKDIRSLTIANLINTIKENKDLFTAETLMEIYPNRYPEIDPLTDYSPLEDDDIVEIEKLKSKHQIILKVLKDIRNKQSAHTDLETTGMKFKFKEIEDIINVIQKMLNKISYRFDRSTTNWDHLRDQAINDTEFLLEDLKKADEVRKNEIKNRYSSIKNIKKD